MRAVRTTLLAALLGGTLALPVYADARGGAMVMWFAAELID